MARPTRLDDRRWKTTPEIRAEIARLYVAGQTQSVLAQQFGLDQKSITSIALAAGLTIRPRKRSGRPRVRVTDEHREQTLILRVSGLSQSAIAETLGICQASVSRILKESDLPAGNTLGLRRGHKHPNWKGGRYDNEAGYSLVLLSADDAIAEMRMFNGYVLEHRLVMARHLGRPLLPTETVHHISGDKSDNRIENLQLRVGQHGKGAVIRCSDCGSERIEYGLIGD